MRLLPLLLLLAAAASAQPSPEGPVIEVRVRVDGAVEVDGVAADSLAVVVAVRAHVRKHPEGTVRFVAARGAPYESYIGGLDRIKAAFAAEREAVAQRLFGAPYDGLAEAARDAVAKRVPLRIALAEPD